MDTKKYNVIFQQEEDGGYSVSVPSLPGCFSQGDTFEKALKNIKEAIELYLEGAENKKCEIESEKEFMVPVEVNCSYA
jgi:predicted RNase H-like HicB family nuclease